MGQRAAPGAYSRAMKTNGHDIIGPNCPCCESKHTIRTFEQFRQRMYFCFDCEYAWCAEDHPSPAERAPQHKRE
jgi:hypothetical protein